jgi:hypothetical protein
LVDLKGTGTESGSDFSYLVDDDEMFLSLDPDLVEVDSEMIESPSNRATLPVRDPQLLMTIKGLDLEEEGELT